MKLSDFILILSIITVLVLSGCVGPEKNNSHVTEDNVPPKIVLLSPENMSFIFPGDEIRLNISDENLQGVEYLLDGEQHPFSYPWVIKTDSWGEGHHILKLNAWDKYNNSASAWFEFIIDLTPPSIKLISPPNNSAMESGTKIMLNISDENLMGANYTLDNGSPQCLPSPFEIKTEWWPEGRHEIRVNAMDMAGNTASASFRFIIDNMPTDIRMTSPESRVIRSGTPLIFHVQDRTLRNISYSINGGNPIPWSSPWVIKTDGWSDGTYSITIRAVDEANHRVIRTYTIDIDNTPPVIEIPNDRNITVHVYTDERNYSSWKISDMIKINISDPHLKRAEYSINGGDFREFKEPYLLNPASWRGRNVSIEIRAMDMAGNGAQASFTVNLTFNLTIYMGKGWSDISIPFMLPTYSIRDVFSCIDGTENGSYSKIESYDGTWHTFNPSRPDKFNKWKEFSPYFGLSINITSQTANFTVSGILSSDMRVNLSSSHPNFLSFISMNPLRVDKALQGVPWYRVQRWDWQEHIYVDMRGDEIMLPGYSYWIYVSYDSVWDAKF